MMCGVYTPAIPVPILDRPEERSQFYDSPVNGNPWVPILDRPEERSQSDRPNGSLKIVEGSNPRSPRRTIAISVRTGFEVNRSSNPRSPRRTIAISLGSTRGQTKQLFQSSIAPKNDRNVYTRSFTLLHLDVPILDRPEERSQSTERVSTVPTTVCSNPRSPRRTIAILE